MLESVQGLSISAALCGDTFFPLFAHFLLNVFDALTPLPLGFGPTLACEQLPLDGNTVEYVYFS